MSESHQPPSFVFGGFDSPNTTQVPDAFFDVVAPQLTEAELRVALYIIRRTFGFKKDSDTISLRQMVEGITTRDGRILDLGTGLKKSAVANALTGLVRKGVILSRRNRSAERGNEPTTYALHIKHQPLSVPVDKGVVRVGGQPLSVPVDTQYTERQETVEQQTVNSNRFDIVALMQKSLNSRNSKKRDKIEKSAVVLNEEPSAPRRGKSTFKPVSQLLSGRDFTRTAPVGPGNGPESGYGPPPGATSRPAPETAPQRPRGRPKQYPVPPGLELFTTDITTEFHDASKLPSNLSFIGRVLQETGLHPDVLYQLMQEARQLTKARGNIEKPSADDPGFRNRFPYFRQTLLDLVEKEGRAVSARRQARSGSP